MFNHSRARDVRVRIDVDADFADLFEVKDALEKKGELYRRVERDGSSSATNATTYVRETHDSRRARQAGIAVDETGADISCDLEPHGVWTRPTIVVPVVEPGAAPRPVQRRDRAGTRDGLGRWTRRRRPKSTSDWRPIERTLPSAASSTSPRCASICARRPRRRCRRPGCPGSWRCSAATA